MALETRDIQGIAVSGYGHLFYSEYWFLHFPSREDTKQWLRKVIPNVTTADWTDAGGKRMKPDAAVNLAFTPAGMEQFGYPESDLSAFSFEFLSGMAEPERARRLGDDGRSLPASWEIGHPDAQPIHVLLILEAPSPDASDGLRQTYERLNKAHNVEEVAPRQRGHVPRNHREHFGFADGISQPDIAGSPRPSIVDEVPAGEFVLGYPNAYGMLPATPTISSEFDPGNHLTKVIHGDQTGTRKDFGRNGTYLVFRKLHQDVAGFRRFVRSASPPGMEEHNAAKMVGRWPSGAPLVLSPTADDKDAAQAPRNNNFAYRKDDPDGLRCPIASHIRRTNPRDGLEVDPQQSLETVMRHRIMRRGASYGPRLEPGVLEDDGKDRGLLFICLNSDIKRQFEFLQQTWINDPKFAGLDHDRDPLVGNNIEAGSSEVGPFNFTIPAVPVRRVLKGIPRFVTTRGGGYFFLPSMSALRFLSAPSERSKTK
jgi:Dyp-type peroxidase family